MFRLISLFCLLVVIFFSPTLVLAAKPTPPAPPTAPTRPTAPTKPTPPPLPEFPEVSGIYSVPERSDLLARVFVHSHRPQAATQPVLVCDDLDSTATVSGTGVRLPSGNWTYQLNLSVPSSIGSVNLPTIATNAFTAIASPQAQVKFVRSQNTSVNRSRLDGKNIIAWGKTSPSALGVTYYWYYPSTGLIAETDTIMNTRFSWSWTNPSVYACSQNASTYDAQDILTHELGHWLGLNDEYTSEFVDHTMYGYGSTGELKKNTLTTGDKYGLKAIYP